MYIYDLFYVYPRQLLECGFVGELLIVCCMFLFLPFSPMMKDEESNNMHKCNLSSKVTNDSNMDNNVPSCEWLRICHWDRTVNSVSRYINSEFLFLTVEQWLICQMKFLTI